MVVQMYQLFGRRSETGPFMTAISGRLGTSTQRRREPVMDYKLELIFVPVGDVDRAKDFYTRIGFHADYDETVSGELRFVQLTPPGSACSIAIGTGLMAGAPGSASRLQLVVDDADAARAELAAAGVDAGEVQELPWGRFVSFADPDGNSWAVQ